jgi:N-acetyl-1-D-myo-inositol-2-amino-2-deoxy-alpha-D-glucopyranoside deacetylase
VIGAARLLVVVAHPDDETFGTGSLIADAARRGVEVTVCCATRGEAGQDDSAEPVADLAVARERELREAAAVLGASRVVLLDYADSGMSGPAGAGTLAGAALDDVVAAVAAVVDDVRPDVVVTLDPELGDGHRDHVRIGAATTAAVRGRDLALYWWCLSRDLMKQWFERLAVEQPDSEHLDLDAAGMGRPDADMTAVVDVRHLVGLRRQAIAVHVTQRSPFEVMPADLQAAFLEADRLVRVQPAWPGGCPATSIL